MTKKNPKRQKPYPLEPLDPAELDKAIAEWRAEDDGSDDYPTLGEVLAERFGAPRKPLAVQEPQEPIDISVN